MDGEFVVRFGPSNSTRPRQPAWIERGDSHSIGRSGDGLLSAYDLSRERLADRRASSCLDPEAQKGSHRGVSFLFLLLLIPARPAAIALPVADLQVGRPIASVSIAAHHQPRADSKPGRGLLTIKAWSPERFVSTAAVLVHIRSSRSRLCRASEPKTKSGFKMLGRTKWPLLQRDWLANAIQEFQF
ncbi:hypothetical protein BDV10DRAFT_138085 [Aspergillus recurvatus]